MDVRVGLLWRRLSTEELMLLNCGVGEDSWESLGLQGEPTSPFWRRSVLDVLWKEWWGSWNSSTLATSCEELTHWKRLWCWEGLGAGGEGDNRGWDSCMASPTRWTWVWVNSRGCWRTGRPSVLQFMGLQRVRRDWVTELNWTEALEMISLSRKLLIPISSVQFSHSDMSDSLQPHGLQDTRPLCLLPTPRVYSNSCPLSWLCHPTISSSVVPLFFCVWSFSASGPFSMSQFFASGSQTIGVSASASVLPMNIHGWFLLGLTGLVSLQGILKSRLQHHSSKASILQHSIFFTVQLSHPYMTTGKTRALTRWISVGKVMSLLRNMLSRLVISFLPRNQHQFNFMAAATICSDFGAPKNKVSHCFHCSPSISQIGLDVMILVLVIAKTK